MFKSGTELVEVYAIVQDGDGAFVPGLTADDFELLEDDRTQPIDLFYLVSGPAQRLPRSRTPEGMPRLQDQSAPRLFVLIFDRDHLSFEGFKRIKDASIAFIEEHFRPGDIGGVVVDGTMANGRLTTDRQELLTVLRGAMPRPEAVSRLEVFREWPRLESEFEALRVEAGDTRLLQEAVERNCAERPEECQRVGVREQVENELQRNAQRYLDLARTAANRLVQTLSAVTTGLGRMEGRKTVVLATEGFLVEDVRGNLGQIAAQAARYGVTVYPIDARGVARLTTGASDASQPGPRMRPGIFDTNEDGPFILASNTGGFVVNNTNQFGRAFERIADDTSTSYVLGYAPPNPTLDGAFRKIEVRVKWKGMRVRARKGYLATPLPPPARRHTGTVDMPIVAPAPVPEAPAGALPAPVPLVANALGLNAVPIVRADANARVLELSALAPARAAGARRCRAASEAVAAEAATRGWASYRRGDVETAERDLAVGAAYAGAPAWVHYALGLSRFALGRFDQSAASFERVRAADPTFQPVYFNLVDSYLQLDRPAQADAVLDAARERWPADADVWNALGMVQYRQGDLDGAIRTFQKAAGLDAGDGLAYFNLGKAYQTRYARARRANVAGELPAAAETDRQRAREYFQRYLSVGGPFATEARAALNELDGEKECPRNAHGMPAECPRNARGMPAECPWNARGNRHGRSHVRRGA